MTVLRARRGGTGSKYVTFRFALSTGFLPSPGGRDAAGHSVPPRAVGAQGLELYGTKWSHRQRVRRGWSAPAMFHSLLRVRLF